MFRFSKGSGYAIAGLVYISTSKASDYTGIDEISRATGISKQYLAKLFRTLASRGIIRSARGRDGGFMLDRDPGAITLLEVVEAIDGPVEAGCAIKDGDCSDLSECLLHAVLKRCSLSVAGILASESIGGIGPGFFCK
ncbi:MAG: Rrf2 family transcriptional regulator [Thermodesulfobacteriota bacterium]|nr:MAG: Rrf2 family transcriptional regulator [Thermodesulfobacteriota bacterium]